MPPSSAVNMWLRDSSLWYRIVGDEWKKGAVEKDCNNTNTSTQWGHRESKYDCMNFYHEIIQSLYKRVILLSRSYIFMYLPSAETVLALTYTQYKRKRWKWKEIKHRNEIMKAGNEKWYNRKFPIKIKSLLLQLYTAKLSSSSSF